MTDTVLLDVADRVATVTLNRPAQLNAFSIEMMEDLLVTVRALREREDVELVVITGAGDHFMAGGDLEDFATQCGPPPPTRLVTFRAIIEEHVNPSVEILQSLDVPVIAKVRGACAGFGLSLMLGCDLALCADSTKFTTAYASIGLPADGGMSFFLPRVVGRRKAMELLLLGERFDAAEALRLGLVNRVAPAAELDAETDRLVARLQSGPRRAYAEIKRLLNSPPDLTLEGQLQSEAEAFARCAATADFVEGIHAFLEKRKPAFRGE